MSPLPLKPMVAALSLAAMTPHALAVDWNDSLTRDILRERGITIERTESSEDLYSRMIQAELYVESERMSRSGMKVLEKKKSLEGVAVGADFPEYIGTVEVTNDRSETFTLSRQLSPAEVQQMKLEAGGSSAEEAAALMTGMSNALLMLGEAMRTGIEDAGFGGLLGNEDFYMEGVAGGKGDALCTALVERGAYGEAEKLDEGILLAGISEKSGRLYPYVYMFGPACMLAKSAESLEHIETPSAEEYARAMKQASDEAARFVTGTETDLVNGHETIRIDIGNLDLPQQLDDGREMTVNEMSIWMDPEYFKRRKFRMEGTMIEGRKKQPFFIERENQDYRRVDDSYLFEPYTEIMRVGGVLSDKEKRELAEAQKELADAERQLAEMPPAQRRMMEKMMGSQMDQLRSLASNGALEMKVYTTSITINPDFSQSFEASLFTGNTPGEAAVGGMLPGADGSNTSLVQLVQGYLADLGYAPGPANGELTTETVIAISQYQAEKGLPVTGEVSAELAKRLQADAASS